MRVSGGVTLEKDQGGEKAMGTQERPGTHDPVPKDNIISNRRRDLAAIPRNVRGRPAARQGWGMSAADPRPGLMRREQRPVHTPTASANLHTKGPVGPLSCNKGLCASDWQQPWLPNYTLCPGKSKAGQGLAGASFHQALPLPQPPR